jgi:hypothetical protein
MSNHLIIDNAVPTDTFKAIQQDLLHDQFDWYFRKGIQHAGDNNSQFIHPFHINGLIATSKEKFNCVFPILDILKPEAICRIKANLTHRTVETLETGLHIDIMIPGALTAIFYVNTTNGYTYFSDGTKVKSIENRLLIFPSCTPHAGATCTDEHRRVVINFNYMPSLNNDIWQKIKTPKDQQYQELWEDRAEGY